MSQIDVSLPFDQLQGLYPRALPLLAEAGIVTGQHRIYTVVVQPGDVLYVPAMWLHHVVTMQGEPAMSVNAFYPSRVQSLMDRINGAPIPFEVPLVFTSKPCFSCARFPSRSCSFYPIRCRAQASWDRETQKAAVVQYICLITDLYHGDAKPRKTCSTTLADLIDTRYAPMTVTTTGRKQRADNAIVCPTEQLTQTVAREEQARRMRDSISKHLLPLFGELKSLRAGELALFQHVEYLLHFFVGKDGAHAFLEQCIIRRRESELMAHRSRGGQSSSSEL